MAAQNLVIVTRTDNGKQFKVSTTKIIEFKDLDAGGSLLTYIDQRGKVDHRAVDETASAIDALTGSRTQAITLYPQLTTLYINSDKIIYIDNMTWGSRITYDISGGKGKYNEPPIFIDCTTAPATINTAAGNTGVVNMQQGKPRWINGDRLDLVTHDPSLAVDFIALYDSGREEFEKLKLSSSNTYLSLGSGWA